jgi:hypothetical protein
MQESPGQSEVYNIKVEKIDSNSIRISACTAYFNIASKILRVVAELENLGPLSDFVSLYISVYTKDGVLIDAAETTIRPFSHMATKTHDFENLTIWPYKIKVCPGGIQNHRTEALGQLRVEGVHGPTGEDSERVVLARPALFKVFYDGKWGFINKSGDLVVKEQFDGVDGFSDGMCAVRCGDKWGFINSTGEIAVSPHYDEVRGFSEGLAAVCLAGKWGVIDRSGDLVIDFQFDLVADFSEGLAPVRLAQKSGVIDRRGDLVIDFQFDFVTGFSEGLAAVQRGENRGYIDRSGRIVVDLVFEEVHKFDQGVAFVRLKDKFGMIDTSGQLIMRPSIDLVVPGKFSNDLKRVRVSDKYGFLDRNGEMVINPQFGEAEEFSEGLAVAGFGTWLTPGFLGYIDSKGRFIIEPQFYGCNSFSEGLASVFVNERWGFIDKTGRMVITPQFFTFDEWIIRNNQMDPLFRNGISLVWLGNKMGYIDTTGKYIWGPSDLGLDPRAYEIHKQAIFSSFRGFGHEGPARPYIEF